MQIPHWEQSIEAMSPFVKNLFENIITLSCPKTSFISTSNYRRKRRRYWGMSIILSSIIEVSMNKIELILYFTVTSCNNTIYSKYRIGNKNALSKLPITVFQINSINLVESEEFRETSNAWK